MASSNQQRGEAITGINVTPLVDVVLVLLIILMVTAGYIVSKTIPVDLPKGMTGETTTLTLAITVDKEGKTYLDAESVSEDALRQRVRQAHARDPETRAVIAADGSTAHRKVIFVIDLLRQEGVSRFAINVQPEEIASRP
ncbi:MAG TPA: biopolymer transporter ExbD [Polyangiaceae bacterium]|nr:biopolymer transporter ExbD [Polyangiaceae bacterium]